MQDFFVFLPIVLALLIGLYGIIIDGKLSRNQWLNRSKKLIIGTLLLFSAVASAIILHNENIEKQAQFTSAVTESKRLQSQLLIITDSLRTTTKSLSDLLIYEKQSLFQSYRTTYPIRDLRMSLGVGYHFKVEEQMVRSYFKRFSLQHCIGCITPDSPYFPDRANPEESQMYQLLYNSNIRVEFTLAGDKSPKLVYSLTNRPIKPEYSIVFYDDFVRVSANFQLGRDKIWIEDESVKSLLDLIGSTMTIYLSEHAPQNNDVSVWFAIKDTLVDPDPHLANLKHHAVLTDKNKLILKSPNYGVNVVAYRKIITASDLGLSDMWSSLPK